MAFSFTAEEAWKAIGNTTSIHLEDFLICEDFYENQQLNTKWQIVKNVVVSISLKKSNSPSRLIIKTKLSIIISTNKNDFKKIPTKNLVYVFNIYLLN